MFRVLRTIILILGMTGLLTACGDKKTVFYTGKVYPPTSKVSYAFMVNQVPRICSVFAQALVTLPAGSTGRSIKDSISDEAKMRGADMILIGQSRQMKDDEGLNFAYYGPEQEYRCTDKWCGWKYGYDAWEEQGEWVNIGLDVWGNARIRFDYPIMMQVAFLHCQ